MKLDLKIILATAALVAADDPYQSIGQAIGGVYRSIGSIVSASQFEPSQVSSVQVAASNAIVSLRQQASTYNWDELLGASVASIYTSQLSLYMDALVSANDDLNSYASEEASKQSKHRRTGLAEAAPTASGFASGSIRRQDESASGSASSQGSVSQTSKSGSSSASTTNSGSKTETKSKNSSETKTHKTKEEKDASSQASSQEASSQGSSQGSSQESSQSASTTRSGTHHGTQSTHMSRGTHTTHTSHSSTRGRSSNFAVTGAMHLGAVAAAFAALV